MLHKTRGIVVHNTPFKDNSVIAHIYTKDFGMQSFIVNGVRNQKGAIRPSHLMPLNLVDLVIYKKENVSIHRIKELRCQPILKTIHYDIMKNSVALFIAEMLYATLREEEGNEELFSYLWHFIELLDLEEQMIGNFPIYFMVHLSTFLGFNPKTAYQPGQVFNLKEGLFLDAVYMNDDCLDTELSLHLWNTFNTGTANISEVKLPRNIRTILLNRLLDYFTYHGLHGRKIKSHIILREVLS